MALAGTLMTGSGALAYHPTGPNPSFEEVERNEFSHVQKGWVPSNPTARTDSRQRFANPADDVYANGQYVGSDPDPKSAPTWRATID